jgi:hypothetical protein
MDLFKKSRKLTKAAGMGCLLAGFGALLSCDLNPPPGQTPEPSSDIFTAYPVTADPVPEYAFESEELMGSPAASGYLVQPQPYAAPPVNTYEWFFNYRLENFSPKTEPLLKERLGGKLGVKRASLWEYSSYNSHAVGFAVSLPAISVVEYGETAAYGNHTDTSESYYFNHLLYLQNLREGTTYHYRIIVRDEDGNSVALPDRTFTTKTFAGEVKLYQGDFTHTVDGGGVRSGLWIVSPGVYVLMEDIVSDGLGINVKAHDVTIDLNGHTLVYDNGVNSFNATENGYNESASYGIRAGLWNFNNIDVYNGVIKQGGTGSPGREPLFLNHMGAAVENEIAGLTVDYYGDSASGMRTGRGSVHHNLLYDRGTVIEDRHAAVRALLADGDSSEAAYNSLRRFRQRGIDGAALVRDNELYCDSFATNSFALGAGDNAVITNNKVFGMGDSPIGIGWGNNIRVADNFIYMWGYSPTKRFDEYERKSSIAGMRVTNYNNDVFENMLFEGNIIVLKASDRCSLARGIWTTNGVQDRNILYRHNTVKVEAMPDNYRPNGTFPMYYNDDVNNAVAAVSVQRGAWVTEAIPDALVFEDNRLISNVNHIVIGEGYGISSGVRFYRTALEKIDHDSDHGYFAPVRLGFWYWNTLANRMIDTKLAGIAEAEMTPDFYGGAGKMEVFYGEQRAFQFLDGDERPLAYTTIAFTAGDSGMVQTQRTDSRGRAAFDILSVRHYQFGNSLENGGVTGTPERTDYQNQTYTFSAEGYRSFSMTP